MISIYDGRRIYSLDNNDEQLCHLTFSEMNEIEDLTGTDIRNLSTEKIKSHVAFINVQ